MALTQEKVFTIDDIYALPDGPRQGILDCKPTERDCNGL